MTSATAPRRRVLIVDDDPLVGRALARALGSLFEVDVERDGLGAIAKLTADPAFDLILCDIQMSPMGGLELFRILSRRNPALARRVVFLSGHVAGADLDFIEASHVPFLPKPIATRTLCGAVAVAIQEASLDR